MPLPLVAIVGRPNVGKSTLFNRFVGQRLAIVEDHPGTTRDRLYESAEWAGKDFTVVDTGGLERLPDALVVSRTARGEQDRPPEDVDERVRNQVLVAIEEADVIVFLTDAMSGVTPGDHDVADLLRRSGKPVILAVNKAERKTRQQDAGEFWTLGIGEPHPVSALHGQGSGDLLDVVVDHLPDVEPEPHDDRLRIAILGRPNVGKSSLLNRLTGRERAVVGATAGTTRDPVDTVVRWEGREFRLIDTAGIRRRGKVQAGIERYSVLRAVRAAERSDVAVLMLDATDGITAQDQHIGGIVQEAGVGAMIAMNKWDLVDKDTYTAHDVEQMIRSHLKFLDYAPLLFISALTGQRAVKVFERAMAIQASRTQRVTTSDLNRLVADLTARHEVTRHGRPLKIRYATQVGIAPPRFVFFVNDTELVHFSYRRYIENQLRQRFGFDGTAVRLSFRDQQRRRGGSER